jgi:hypothetical protein
MTAYTAIDASVRGRLGFSRRGCGGRYRPKARVTSVVRRPLRFGDWIPGFGRRRSPGLCPQRSRVFPVLSSPGAPRSRKRGSCGPAQRGHQERSTCGGSKNSVLPLAREAKYASDSISRQLVYRSHSESCPAKDVGRVTPVDGASAVPAGRGNPESATGCKPLQKVLFYNGFRAVIRCR